VSRRADVVALTDDYEKWLGERIPLVAADLVAKHEQMAASVLRFLRGTYYLWLDRIVTLQPELMRQPRVPAVGDLHVENFGTWRDRDGVRRWGVNDLDEVAWAAYPIDLVRLATSAVLAPAVALSSNRLCRILLDHWHDGAAQPAVDVDADAARHLRELVPISEPGHDYYAALTELPPAHPDALPEPVASAIRRTVTDAWTPTWHHRRAGTGSLGHPRIVAVGQTHARETKLLGPGSNRWLQERMRGAAGVPETDQTLYSRITTAVHGPFPGLRVHGWQIRRLAPDVVRINVSGLSGRDADRVVRSMAEAVAAVHGVDAAALAAARAHSATMSTEWLAEAVDQMSADIRACHHDWRRHFRG
jgi:hypothetical protein